MRIIPARAGFTRRPSHGPAGIRDHPRSRGVYARRRSARVRLAGSSPLARGLLVMRSFRDIPGWIIPARAGFTKGHQGHGVVRTDHPRSRGVYVGWLRPQPGGRGSSPLARGLPLCESGENPGVRIIPARAGFTLRNIPFRIERVDHPRSRGVYRRRKSAWPAFRGSSPLARGLPQYDNGRGVGGRIIPARAGFTSTPHRTHTRPRDHPRSRGVYRATTVSHSPSQGSSPLARGLHLVRHLPERLRRIIPARAGFTPTSSPSAGSSEDHPRSRGVY